MSKNCLQLTIQRAEPLTARKFSHELFSCLEHSETYINAFHALQFIELTLAIQTPTLLAFNARDAENATRPSSNQQVLFVLAIADVVRAYD